ncbi:MAG: flagellar hook-length control protein FliK [Marinicaulis sp.]|nr:flagellar hook-length control protein FliK [Marinicaulis sp.]
MEALFGRFFPSTVSVIDGNKISHSSFGLNELFENIDIAKNENSTFHDTGSVSSFEEFFVSWRNSDAANLTKLPIDDFSDGLLKPDRSHENKLEKIEGPQKIVSAAAPVRVAEFSSAIFNEAQVRQSTGISKELFSPALNFQAHNHADGHILVLPDETRSARTQISPSGDKTIESFNSPIERLWNSALFDKKSASPIIEAPTNVIGSRAVETSIPKFEFQNIDIDQYAPPATANFTPKKIVHPISSSVTHFPIADIELSGIQAFKIPDVAQPALSSTSWRSVESISLPAASNPMSQIAAVIRSDNSNGNIEIQIDPPELGRVRIEFVVESKDAIKAVLISDRPETVDYMRRNSGELQQQLRSAGFEAIDLSFSSSKKRLFESKAELSAFNENSGEEFDGDTGQVVYLSLGDAWQVNLLA